METDWMREFEDAVQHHLSIVLGMKKDEINKLALLGRYKILHADMDKRYADGTAIHRGTSMYAQMIAHKKLGWLDKDFKFILD